MSSWIRAAGEGHPWHRVSVLEARNAFGALEAGEFRLMCGETIPTAGGWTEAVPEVVPQDDQHAACEHRAKREAHWLQRFLATQPTQPTPWLVRDLIGKIDPALERVQIQMDPRKDGPQRLRLLARNLDTMVEASGRTMNEAIGELLAMIEIDVYRPAHPGG